MSGILPANLISTATSEISGTEDADPEVTNSQILHRFWKGLFMVSAEGQKSADGSIVHAIQSDLIQDAATTRSRNLFWRVWSSPHLAQSITSARLHSLWQQFSRHVDLSPIEIDPTFWNGLQGRSSGDASSSTSKETAGDPDRAGPSAQRQIEQDGGRQSEASGSTSNTTSESSPRPLGRRASGSKGRVPTATSGGRPKPRPLLGRRKSSQSRTQQIIPPRSSHAALKSPRKDSVQEANKSEAQPPGGFPALPAVKGPTFALPTASSWEDDSSSEKPTVAADSQDLSASLVDRGFRGRFVDSQKQLASATNLPALGRMRKTGSVVRFADEVVEDLGKGREKEQLSPVQDEGGEACGKRASVGSQAISDDSDSEGMTISRNKSSLSLQIKDLRKQSGSHDLGPMPLAAENQARGRETRKKEEELLSMGRKAGAPHPHKLSSHTDHRYRSPSPGPLF